MKRFLVFVLGLSFLTVTGLAMADNDATKSNKHKGQRIIKKDTTAEKKRLSDAQQADRARANALEKRDKKIQSLKKKKTGENK